MREFTGLLWSWGGGEGGGGGEFKPLHHSLSVFELLPKLPLLIPAHGAKKGTGNVSNQDGKGLTFLVLFYTIGFRVYMKRTQT